MSISLYPRMKVAVWLLKNIVFLKIEVQMIHIIVLVSHLQQSDSFI